MGNLSARAASLLSELAKDHGVGPLDFDADGLIPMTIHDKQVAVAFSPANDSFFFVSLVQTPDEARSVDPWLAFEMSGLLAKRRTRLAIEPGSKALMLVREIPLAGLAYWQFIDAIDEFLGDLASALKDGSGHAGKSKPPPPDLSADMLMIRI